MTSPTADTISAVTISEILGVTRGTITNWKSRKDDFPEPVAGTAHSPLYDRQEIFQWLIDNGKATEKQLRGMGVEKIVAQLLGTLRNQALDGEVLGAALCYTHLSRNGILPESCRWTRHMPDELADAIRKADHWTRSSPLTYGLEIFAPLSKALEGPAGSGELIAHILDRISAVHDLEAFYEAFLDALRSKYGEGSLPADVATLVARLVPEDARSVFDPYCMNGSLVVACAKEHPGTELVAASPYRRSLESAVRWALIADLNLGAIDGDVIDGIGTELHADAVVCNAPWGMRLSDRSRSMIRDTDPRWLFGTPHGDLHWALLQDAIYRLNSGGRAVVLCPKSVLFNTAGGARSIREGLLRNGCVEAVIAAPPGSLQNTGIAFCVLVLTRPGEAADTQNVLLVDLDKPKRGARPDFSGAVQAYRAWTAGAAVDAGNAFRAPVHEILAPQGSLDPTKWKEAANRPDADAITASLDLAQKELENSLAVTTTLDTRWTARAGRASRYAAIGSLTDISIHRGAPLDRRVLDADADTGVPVLSLEFLSGRGGTEDIRYVDPETVRGKPVLTKPGDVIAHPTPSGIVVRVWNEAGWLPNSHAEILRITDADAFDPEFLALCLSSRLITDPVTVGSVVPRAQSKNVTIPLIPIADQRSIIAYRRQIDTVADYGQRLTQAAGELQRALADAAASGITMTPP